MNRNHIHFAKGFATDKEVISGIRPNCSIAIIIDLAAALADGIPFFESTNGVILTPGNSDGFLETKWSQVDTEIVSRNDLKLK